MRRRLFAVAMLFALLVGAAPVASAQQARAYRGTYQSVRQLILRIESRAEVFRDRLQTSLNRRSTTTISRGEDPFALVSDFAETVRHLHERFDRRQSTAADAREVLNRAARIDDYLRRYTVDAETQNNWSSMRVDLNQVAAAYSVSWPEAMGSVPPSGNRTGNRLTGTYRLDLSHSDNARDMAERATRDLPRDQRQRVLDSITRRLDSPEQIAIDVRGRTVKIASSRAAQIVFEADGRDRIETGRSGRTIHARATLTGGQLMVSTTGDTGNDFNVTFDSIDDGQRLTVTRRVFAQGLTQPVVVQSNYVRTAEVAQFDVYDPQQPSATRGDFVVRDGETVIATLDDALSTKTAAVGDKFTLRVSQPAEFEGATIEGHVSSVQRSGRLTGRSVMTLDFDNIRLRDGRSYRFAGILESVRTANGETVKVDTEGTVKDDSQTKKTEQRTAIGTAVGAIIGAGSVYVQGRDDLDLGRGSELTIRSGAPMNNPR